MSSVLFDAIHDTLDRKSMLKHRFYRAWNEGKLTKDSLREYACQYYHFVREFPRMVSAVHSNTPEFSVRQELLRNLIDEEQGPENHPALWMQFANALGASQEDVLRTTPLPTTTALVAVMMDSCRRGSFQEGAAALYGYESQIPEVSRVKREGLKKFYGITDPVATKFFSVHEEADVYHSQAEREMIERHTPVELFPAVQRASARTAEALWNFLDGVYEAYVAQGVTMC